MFCLATGAVLEAAVGKYQGKQTGENALFRRTWDELTGRATYRWGTGSSVRISTSPLLKRRGVDSVCRLHQARISDYRAGRRLGKEDHIVRWAKPARPDWMDEATYRVSCPGDYGSADRADSRVEIAGFRTRVLDVVTTLIHADLYRKKDLADLYRRRWEAELHLRSIKAVLGLDVLRCKTPAMVRKEIGMGLLVYNVIRGMMAAGCKSHGQRPHRVSFKGALQTLLAFAEPALREEAREATAMPVGDPAGLDRRRRGGASPGPSRAAGGETPAQAVSAC